MKHRLWNTAVARIEQLKEKNPELYLKLINACYALGIRKNVDKRLAEMWILTYESQYPTEEIPPEYN